MPCQPEKLASTGNTSPLLRRPSNSITVPAASSAAFRIENEDVGHGLVAGANRVERTADHLLRLVAEDRVAPGFHTVIR